MKNFTQIRGLFYFWQQIQEDNLFIYAQALTFTTLLTFIPLAGFIISVLKIFIPYQKIISSLEYWLINYLTPSATHKALNLFLDLLERLERFPLGKFSLVTYFLMSTGIFFQTEDALNKIFKTKKRRTYLQRIGFYWFFITLLPFLLLIPVSFHSLSIKIATPLGLLFIPFFFFLFYMSFPARKISKKLALLGALFSGTLWFFSSYAFSIYVKYAITYSKVYGSLASIPLFLIWLFLNWVIFLLGAELIVFFEKKRWNREEFKELPLNFFKLFLIYLILKAYYQKEPLNVEKLCNISGFSLSVIEPIIENFEKMNLITFSEDKGLIALLVSPDRVYLSEILELSLPQNLKNFKNKDLENFYKSLVKSLDSFKITLREFYMSIQKNIENL